MTALYDLRNQYLAVAEMGDDPGMDAQTIADTLEGIEGEIEAKAQALLQVVANLEGDTGAIDNEIKRLQGRKKAIENRTNRLRSYLKENMEATGIDKISCPLFAITLCRPKPKLIITDEQSIPAEYVEVVEVRKPDRKALLAALKAGKDIPGCAVGKSARSLLIK